MKNLSFLVLLLFLSSCSEDISPNYDVEKKVYYSNNAKELNKLSSQLPHDSEHSFRNTNIIGSEYTATSDLLKLIDKTPISDWKDLDLEVKAAIEKLEKDNEDKKYNIAIQNGIYRFLVTKLYKVDESQSVASELKFYLDLLISKDAIEWDILAFGILKLEDESGYDTSSLKKYTIEGASAALDKYLALNKKILKEESDLQLFHQKAVSHYQKSIDDSNYALTHLCQSND